MAFVAALSAAADGAPEAAGSDGGEASAANALSDGAGSADTIAVAVVSTACGALVLAVGAVAVPSAPDDDPDPTATAIAIVSSPAATTPTTLPISTPRGNDLRAGRSESSRAYSSIGCPPVIGSAPNAGFESCCAG